MWGCSRGGGRPSATTAPAPRHPCGGFPLGGHPWGRAGIQQEPHKSHSKLTYQGMISLAHDLASTNSPSGRGVGTLRGPQTPGGGLGPTEPAMRPAAAFPVRSPPRAGNEAGQVHLKPRQVSQVSTRPPRSRVRVKGHRTEAQTCTLLSSPSWVGVPWDLDHDSPRTNSKFTPEEG